MDSTFFAIAMYQPMVITTKIINIFIYHIPCVRLWTDASLNVFLKAHFLKASMVCPLYFPTVKEGVQYGLLPSGIGEEILKCEFQEKKP